MDIKDSDNDSMDGKDEFEILKITIDIKEEKYLLKIFPSEDEDALIFKLEKEKIQTYYFVEIFDLRDFRLKNKLFILDDNINELYSHLKEIRKNCSIELEIKVNRINVLFISNNDSKFILAFQLKKIMVPQKQLNPLLFKQVQENKSKLKLLKRQITKLNKTMQIKTDIINDFNNNIDKINNMINNINNVNENLNSNINKKKEKEEKKNLNNNHKEVKPSKEKTSKQEIETIEKRYISNSRKRKNKKQNKKIKYAQMNNNSNNNNTPDVSNIFCFENVEILGNKKIFEFLVLFNIITIVVILCLLGSIYSIKSDLEYEKLIEEDFLNKLAYLNIGNEYYDDEDEEQDYPHNIFKNKNGDIDFKKYNNSLFENDNQVQYFKEEIAKKYDDLKGIKDIDFILKYKSKTDQKGFDKFFNNCKNIKDSLILMKNNKGKKLAIFSKNIYDILHGTISRDSIENLNNFFLYSFNINDILEYSFKNNYEIYTSFIQCISKWLSEEEASTLKKFDSYNKNKYGKNIFKNIDEIEIYQVKYKK